MKKNNSESTPVLEMLRGAKDRAWLHMPGHGGVLPWLAAALDTTELPGTDDLAEPAPGGAFEAAQDLMAQTAGAAGCIFLAGGSTLGVQMMMLAFVPLGGKVILERSAHKSAIAACAIGGFEPVFVSPRWDVDCSRAFLKPEDVIAAIRENPDARAVLLTRPDYYGVCTDIRSIAQACGQAGMALLVDQAHGAHFMYGNHIQHAGLFGADAWTDSAHKTLPALTQSACLFYKQKRCEAALRRALHVLGTSSPSFLLAASLDWARARMEQFGARWMEGAIAENKKITSALANAGYGDSFALWERRGAVCDATRLVVETSIRGISGVQAQAILSAHGIDIEMADVHRIVCLPPLMETGDARARLARALMDMPAGKPLAIAPPQAYTPKRARSVREAAFGAFETVPTAEAEGRVCAEAFGTYPPGIPLAMPGEIIDREMIAILLDAVKSGARLFGLEDGKIRVLEES